MDCRTAIGPKVDGQRVLSKYFFYYLFRSAVGRQVHAPLWGTRAYVGGLPMTYDLEVILKYCGRSSYDLRSQSHLDVLWKIPMTSWASVGGLGSFLGPLRPVLGLCGRSWPFRGPPETPRLPQEVPRGAKSAPKSGQERPKRGPRAAKSAPRATQERPRPS